MYCTFLHELEYAGSNRRGLNPVAMQEAASVAAEFGQNETPSDTTYPRFRRAMVEAERSLIESKYSVQSPMRDFFDWNEKAVRRLCEVALSRCERFSA